MVMILGTESFSPVPYAISIGGIGGNQLLTIGSEYRYGY